MADLIRRKQAGEAWETAVDTGGGGGGAYPASALQVFVDYVNGSDSNDGLSPSSAFKLITTAYSYLQTTALATYAAYGTTLGVGRIILLPGKHNIGTGLAVDYRYPVVIQGSPSGSGYTQGTSASIVYSSSAAATELILTGSTSHVTYGNKIYDVVFEVNPAVNTAMTALVRTRANDYFSMERCYGQTTDGTNRDVPLLVQNPGGSAQDNAWCMFDHNVASGVPLYYAMDGTNFNRSVITRNVCQFGGSATYPMIWLEGDWWNGLISGNNLEGGGSNAAIMLGSVGSSADGNVLIANSGEAAGVVYPFIEVFNGGGNIFIGGNCSATGGGNGTFIQFDTLGYGNSVFNRFVTAAGTSGYKRKLVDNSTYPAMTQFHGRDGRVLYQKTGAGPTFSSSDFVSIPRDGSLIGATHASVIGTPLQRLALEVGSQLGTTVASPTTTIAAGKLAVAIGTTNANKVLSSMADSVGNTWTVDQTVTDGTRTCFMASCYTTTTITTGNTVTLTWSTATSGVAEFWLIEVPNIVTSSPFDKSAEATGNSTNPTSGATSTLAQSMEIVFEVCRGNGTSLTKGSSYTSFANASLGTGATVMAYKIVAATTAVTGDFTMGSSTWAALVGTYKGFDERRVWSVIDGSYVSAAFS